MFQQNASATENENGTLNPPRIIVIGASAGGFEAIKSLIAGLPPTINAAIFIVWHMSPDVRGILPQVLNRINALPAAHAYNGEAILKGRIYVAPPDHHLLIEDGKMLVTRGPKENRFRPAVDPLFRSAAYAHGARVIGIILSGALDDGTAGLWTVKQYGGIAIVQNPKEAEVSSMPESAMNQVKVDYCVGVAEMGPLLVRLTESPLSQNAPVMKDEQTKKEIQIAAEKDALQTGLMRLGELTPYACPECHGVLSRLQNGDIVRYRCHTGHAYSADALLASITEKVEDSL